MNQRDNDENEATNTLAIVALGFLVGFFWPGCDAEAQVRDCPPYNSEDYPYPQSIEKRIVRAQGGMFSPYTLKVFDNLRQSDVEHIVPRHVAHKGGLCHASPGVKRIFATTLTNLTLASPAVNRYQKSDKGPSEWLPPHSQCWYARRWDIVGHRFNLKYTRADRAVIDDILASCAHTRMERPTSITNKRGN